VTNPSVWGGVEILGDQQKGADDEIPKDHSHMELFLFLASKRFVGHVRF